jgi:Circularly permutated YpsA SLOG family
MRPMTIISGGQTGADRAALDFAIEHGFLHGGWCPLGRLAEDGPIAERYELRQTPLRRYAQRTEWNVRDSDATVVFSVAGVVRGGSALTIAAAKRLDKPWLHLAMQHVTIDDAAARLREFRSAHHVARLNVAGPRASQEPQVAGFVRDVLRAALAG